MNTFAVALFAIFATAHAGLLAPSARIIQGPSTRTTVVGNDGSVISAVAPGGSIVTEEHPGVVAQTAHVVAAAPAVATYAAAPAVVAHAAPIIAHAAPAVATYAAAPAIAAYAAPVAHVGSVADTVIAGPSGTIVSGRHAIVY